MVAAFLKIHIKETLKRSHKTPNTYTKSATRETHLPPTRGSGQSTSDAELLTHMKPAVEMRNLLERSDSKQPGGFANAQRKMAEENERACLLTKLILSESISLQNRSDRIEKAMKNGELPFSSG